MSYQLLCSSYSMLLSVCPRCLMWDFYLSPTLVGKYLMTILFIAETPTRPPIHSSPFCTLFPRYHGGLNEQTRVSLWIIILFPLVNPPRHDLSFILLQLGIYAILVRFINRKVMNLLRLCKRNKAESELTTSPFGHAFIFRAI